MRAGSVPAAFLWPSMSMWIVVAACERPPADPFDPCPSTLAALRDFFSRSEAAHAELLPDAEQTYAASWELLGGAQEHVEIVAEDTDDLLRRAVRGHLALLARRGVSWRWRQPMGALELAIVDGTVAVARSTRAEQMGGVRIDGPGALGRMGATIAQLPTMRLRDARQTQLDDEDPSLVLLAGAMGAWLEGRVPNEPRDAMMAALERAGIEAWGGTPSPAALSRARADYTALSSQRALRGVLPLTPPRRHRAELRLLAARDALPRLMEHARRTVFVDGPSAGPGPRLRAALGQSATSQDRIRVTHTNSGRVILDDVLLALGADDPDSFSTPAGELVLLVRSRSLAREAQLELEEASADIRPPFR